MTELFLHKNKREDFREFLESYSTILDFDVEEMYEAGERWLRAFKADETTPEYDALLAKWLNSNRTDFSVYDDLHYVLDSWTSWALYSSRALHLINKRASDKKEVYLLDFLSRTSALDLGAGHGYSTVAMSEILPNATVTATQLEGTHQIEFARKLFESKPRLAIQTEKDPYQKTDIIFASEYFEHFDRPIHHLDEIMAADPDYLVTGNTFTVPDAVGHFEKFYNRDEVEMTGKEMGGHFARQVRKMGYKNQVIRFWNTTPCFWIHERVIDRLS